MSDIKWIKITTDIFDDEKILLIESMPDADAIIVIWFKLLVLAGKTNNCGLLTINDTIPYNDEMLATIFRRPLNTVRLALDVFEQFGMIDIINDTICIPKWEVHQNIEGMDKIRQQTRDRMRDYRARKRLGITSVGETCVYCGKPANAIDHIIPRAKGGEDVEWNLVPCCKSCNSSKKDKDLADFLNDSFAYTYQGVDHNLVRSNEKLMSIAPWDEDKGQYVMSSDVTVTKQNKNKKKNKKEDKDKEKEHSISSSILSEEFESLWKLYPRKHGKKKALDYYTKARKNGTTYEEVKQGIEAYANYVKAERTEDRFIKHGSTFFSEQAWQDEWVSRGKASNFAQEADDILDGIL